MVFERLSQLLLGSAIVAVAAYLASVATAETVADAFEPDLESWDALS